jgi:hypothetical protein
LKLPITLPSQVIGTTCTVLIYPVEELRLALALPRLADEGHVRQNEEWTI